MASVENRPVSATTFTVTIDSDGPDAGFYNQFHVQRCTSVGPPPTMVDVFTIDEVGLVGLKGKLKAQAPPRINNSSGGTDLAQFQVGGATVAAFGAIGLGDFSVGGLKHRVETTTGAGTGDPRSRVSGSVGQILFWDDSDTGSGGGGFWWVCMCTGGTNWKIKVED